MTTKEPTPQGISALLRKAGFQRSSYGDKGVMWNEATPGYSVWKNLSRRPPGAALRCRPARDQQ